MAAASHPSDDSPDFSFLGDDAAEDASGPPDVHDADDLSEIPDFSDVGEPAEVSETPANPPPVEQKPKRRVARPVTPAASNPTAKPAMPAEPSPKRVSRLQAVKKKSATPTAVPAESNDGDAQALPADSAVAGRRRNEKLPQRPSPAEPVSDDTSPAASEGTVSRKVFSVLAAYAGMLTLLFLYLLITGRVSPTGAHPLESLPDVKPLKSNEFQRVNEGDPLPAGHALHLGESRRFGDIVLTPTRVTREPVSLVDPTGQPATGFSNQSVLKLWFTMENVSSDIAFPPWDVHLMCLRSESEGVPVANSWLMVQQRNADAETQVLNFYHSPDSSFDMVDFHSNQLVPPGQTLTSFIAAGEELNHISADKVEGYRWRMQFRKGVHVESGNGVTTLVDISFAPDDIDA